jgi:hypothetical protein
MLVSHRRPNTYHSAEETNSTYSQITDSRGKLQYIPFPICAETSAPLSLRYGHSGLQNCTISLTDPLFHLLEFYIHNDSPLTCRVPSLRFTIDPSVVSRSDSTAAAAAASDPSEDDGFTPLSVGLAGVLQHSHLHIGNSLNVALHTTTTNTGRRPAGQKRAGAGRERQKAGGHIEAAGAYSVASATRNVRIVIGDDLTFMLDVRWYEGLALPRADGKVTGGGGGFTTWLFGVLVGAGVVWGWRRAVERRSKGQSVLPKYTGYSYGVGTSQPGDGYGFGGGIGKRE